jgi:methylenetetrahydrofolate reductase (NADPH)
VSRLAGIEKDAHADHAAIETFLSGVVFDSMPSEEFGSLLTEVPPDATIAINLVPGLGTGPTVECAEQASEKGYDVVPHIAARFIEDRDELDAIADRLVEAGVEELFVPGGAREEPIGEFESAHELLIALEELGYSFEDVGIAGYPTGHESIDDATLEEAMETKAPHATYIATQLTFDSAAILEWLTATRDRGIELPVEVGVPGVMNYRRLMHLSRKWGAARPLRFVRKTMGIVGLLRRLVGSWGTYRPDDIVADLAPHCADEQYGVRRARFYTFNQIADTERWRREQLDGGESATSG